MMIFFYAFCRPKPSSCGDQTRASLLFQAKVNMGDDSQSYGVRQLLELE
jgi:hypothetical protein